jgi:hypothetical protein
MEGQYTRIKGTSYFAIHIILQFVGKLRQYVTFLFANSVAKINLTSKSLLELLS